MKSMKFNERSTIWLKADVTSTQVYRFIQQNNIQLLKYEGNA
jgi:hypothetical protein